MMGPFTGNSRTVKTAKCKQVTAYTSKQAKQRKAIEEKKEEGDG